MNLLADESVDFPIVKQLRSEGHSVVAIAELSPSISDDEVLEIANAQQSVVLTGDKDFGELLFRLRRVSAGIILIRLSGLSATLKANVVSKAVQEHGDEMVGCFTVIESNTVRIRKNVDGS